MRIMLPFIIVAVLSAPGLSGAAPIKIIKQGRVRVAMQPNNTFVTKAERSTELAASYPAPPRPSSSHVCKRADLDTKVVAAKGGKVFTKGACDASSAGPHAAWPLKAVFKMTGNVQQQAGRSCRSKVAKRKRDKHPNAQNSFMFANKFAGKIHLRYCFLDTKKKKVDCGKEGIHKTHSVQVSYLVNCIPSR